jgi:FeS assembly SUF system regulator
VLRLSKLTDYGVVVLARMGEGGRDGEAVPQSAPGLAARTSLPEPTVSKVLKILSQAGLVEGLRGARGGYRLARPLAAIPLSEVIVAFEGPIALTACVEGGGGGCESEGLCPVRGRWDPVNKAIRAALETITVADLAAGAAAAPLPPIRLAAE